MPHCLSRAWLRHALRQMFGATVFEPLPSDLFGLGRQPTAITQHLDCVGRFVQAYPASSSSLQTSIRLRHSSSTTKTCVALSR